MRTETERIPNRVRHELNGVLESWKIGGEDVLESGKVGGEDMLGEELSAKPCRGKRHACSDGSVDGAVEGEGGERGDVTAGSLLELRGHAVE